MLCQLTCLSEGMEKPSRRLLIHCLMIIMLDQIVNYLVYFMQDVISNHLSIPLLIRLYDMHE